MPRRDTFDAAQALLTRIQDYWSERGYVVKGAIKNAGYNDRLRSTVFEVETDLIAGLPQKRKSRV